MFFIVTKFDPSFSIVDLISMVTSHWLWTIVLICICVFFNVLYGFLV